MSGFHARLSASSAHRWMACPGSVALCETVPSRSSAYAVEGTLAHEIAATCWRTGVSPEGHLGREVLLDGHAVKATPEMVEAVTFYIDELRRRAGNNTVFVEVPLTKALKKLHPDFGGTADAVIHLPEERRLEVVDLKYGSGVLVNAEDNPQLMYYALGALLSASLTVDSVTVVIVQPRASGDAVKESTFPTVDLLDFIADLKDAAARVEKSPDLVPGEKQCRFCQALPVCPAVEQHQQALLTSEFEVVAALSPERLAEILDVLPLIEARVKALREFAYEEAVAGRAPTGWKLVEKRAVRSWMDEKEAAEAVAAVEDAFSEPKLKSVAQVEKVLGKKEFEARLGNLVAKASSGLTLARATDPRPPATTGVLEAFDNVNED